MNRRTSLRDVYVPGRLNESCKIDSQIQGDNAFGDDPQPFLTGYVLVSEGKSCDTHGKMEDGILPLAQQASSITR